MTALRLGEPVFLWLLLLVPLVWALPRRVDDVRHAAIRSLCLALLIVGLARPVWVHDGTSEHHVFVVDRSPSVAQADRARAAEALERMQGALPGSARVTVIEVGSAGAPVEGRERIEGSALGDALAAAERAVPEGARGSVVLLTDGLSTARDWGPALARITQRGLPLHTLRLASSDQRPRPVGVSAREPVRVGQTARVRVDLVGVGSGLTVRLLGPDGELAFVEDVALDGRATTWIEFEPASAGFLPVSVAVEGSDTIELATTLAVQDPLRVLHLGTRVAGASARLAELLGPGFTVEGLGSEGGVPDFGRHDVVILDDLPATQLPDADQQRLVDAVTRRGLGLIMSGGSASFGPGGYHDTPVGDVLPVECVQKEEKRDPSTTLVVIVDTSGSMGGQRVQLAKEVSRLAMRRLLPHDKVGIVEFYGAKRWAAPIQAASNHIELQRALNRLNAGGGTVILPAIEEAFYGLQNVQTRYKHVLVLTDGGVETGAFEPLLRKMADKGINVSTVLIGPEAHSEFLVTLANWGKGRFYNVPNRFNLPEILLKQPTTARLPAYRPGVHPVTGRGGPAWWGSVPRDSLPALAGYVETQARDGAEVVIETSKGAHPVLASWRYGLGRVTAFTTEPTGPGTDPWSDWDSYGPLLARVVSRTASDLDPPIAFDLVRRGRRLRVTGRRRLHGDAVPRARVLDEDGGQELASLELAFREIAEGHFEADLLHAPASDARVLAGVVDTAQEHVTRLVSHARADRAPELQVDPAGALDLARASKATGGRALGWDDVAEFVPATGGGTAPREVLALWPLVLLLGLVTYLGDLLYRRWPTRSVS